MFLLTINQKPGLKLTYLGQYTCVQYMIISLLSTLNNPALFNEDVFESFPSADNELKLNERYQTESRIPGEA